MRLNYYLAKGTLVGALGGLLFGFDTAVISGTTQQLTDVFHLSPFKLGVTVSVAVAGAVIGAISSGELGQKRRLRPGVSAGAGRHRVPRGGG